MKQMKLQLSKYVACICEGAAEEAIVNLLLDGDLLLFSRNDLLEQQILRCRQGNKFEQQYLRKGFDAPISVVRILDSRNEKFRISKAYQHNVDVINVVTAPEIEMLIIYDKGEYTRFKKSQVKPSEFCKSTLGMRSVKSNNFIRSYFNDVSKLVDAIKLYRSNANIPSGEYTLADLLK